eukprot:3934770-Rhodomonas_salina.1
MSSLLKASAAQPQTWIQTSDFSLPIVRRNPCACAELASILTLPVDLQYCHPFLQPREHARIDRFPAHSVESASSASVGTRSTSGSGRKSREPRAVNESGLVFSARCCRWGIITCLLSPALSGPG